MTENMDLRTEAEMEIEEKDEIKDKYLIFFLNKIEFAISLEYVTEIVGVQHPTRIPKLPAYVDGVVNLRGKIVPIIDTRTKFSMERTEPTEKTSVIVIEQDDIVLGIVVDDVDEVIMIPQQSIGQPLVSKTGSESKYISGIGKLGESRTVFILDVDIMLQSDAD